MTIHRTSLAIWLLGAVLLASAPAVIAADTEGVHCSVVTDQDGDDVILMESEWISMHLLPRMQAIINRFVFRPTGNDIVEVLTPKIRKRGGGILMDCFWEQDWRFQELKEKPYSFKITQSGPEIAQAVCETDIVGWVGGDNSGIISKLLSNLTLRRTVTLKAGQPFFRFDFEFINNDKNAKRPNFWVHNSSCVNPVGLESVIRPGARANMETRGKYGREFEVRSPDYIRDFNQGWSARISRERREGIVYLMDYDYVEQLYNCVNTTSEWMYDGILSTSKKAWKGHIYILPIIGLGGVDYANKYFICEINLSRDGKATKLKYRVTSSFEKAAQVTFNTEVEYNLVPEGGDVFGKTKLKPITIDGLGIQPASGQIEFDLDSSDPLVLNISAFVELPDGSVKKFPFQYFYTGEYDSGQGINTLRSGKPVRLLDREVRRPAVPEPPPGLALAKDRFDVFGVLGLGSERMGVSRAMGLLENSEFEIGYCTGVDAYGYGLGDFPYDYERLFKFRTLIFSNAQFKEIRSIGASILMPWLKAGGGLVISGGEFAFDFEFREHPFNDYLPIDHTKSKMVKKTAQLQPPTDASHPIFKGVKLDNLPWLSRIQETTIKENTNAKVLMTVADQPFIIEKKTDNQTTMLVACNQFGNSAALGEGRTALHEWSEWPRLYANIVQYAGGALQ